MGEPVRTADDKKLFQEERNIMTRWRDAQGFCKELLHIDKIMDARIEMEEKINFEKCLTENFLLKYGDDYFGKRDVLFIDLLGTRDSNRLYD